MCHLCIHTYRSIIEFFSIRNSKNDYRNHHGGESSCIDELNCWLHFRASFLNTEIIIPQYNYTSPSLLTSSPCLCGRGLPLSRVRLPVSTKLARTNLSPSRSYSLSAGFKYRESHGMYVTSSIEIAVMDNPTFGACP